MSEIVRLGETRLGTSMELSGLRPEGKECALNLLSSLERQSLLGQEVTS